MSSITPETLNSLLLRLTTEPDTLSSLTPTSRSVLSSFLLSTGSISAPDAFAISNSSETIAFAFDIDGVLHKSGVALPNASASIERLQALNIPYVYLTNGGTATEEGQAAKLSKTLGGVTVEGRNFIQSHTPWLDIVPELADKYILVVGGEGNSCRETALAYGFKKVITPFDIKVRYPSIYQFSESERYRSIAKDMPVHDAEKPIEIAAITVWSSSRDWGMDLQIVTDVLMSEGGKLGTKATVEDGVAYPHNGVQMLFCNPDYTFANAYHLPRMAQGALKAALEGILWFQHGKSTLVSTSCGKPTHTTYAYAEKVLNKYHADRHAESGSTDPLPFIKTVYMVGDNPLSDIAGANAFQSTTGAEWKSLLVETGVHIRGTVPAVTPTAIVHGVKEAIDHGLAEMRIL